MYKMWIILRLVDLQQGIPLKRMEIRDTLKEQAISLYIV